MSKTIICSVGTSAAKKLGIPPKNLVEWINQQSSIEDAADQIFRSFREFQPTEETNLVAHLSAEIHSLVRMGLDSSDRVLLFTSETEDGYCCGLAVEKYLTYYWSEIKTETKKITGLQVSDANKFRNQGVVEFIKKATQAIENYGNVILNPTGGYKALVPYTVLLGMIKEIECRYIFEQSTSLLELPPFPVEFKRSQFEVYKDIFETIDRDSFISKQQWENRVPYQERLSLEPLIERSNEEITLSGVGFLFLEEMRKPSALVPFLSRKAIDDCFDKVAQLDDCDPFRFLQRVSASQEALTQAEHINVGDGLRWLKPGRTTDRYLVSVEGWRLLVWRVIREDQKGSQYARNVQVNPERDRAKYSPFIRMEYVN
jgi:putative CRISPR-associated protein (TIGR02619 family)